MSGLRLMLRNDNGGSPGNWFWRCFGPLRVEFDRYHWLVPLQPWMGPPRGFEEGGWALDYPGARNTELMLWRSGAIGRWADHFAAESIDLTAVPLGEDAIALATGFARSPWHERDSWVAERGEFVLRYTDSATWDIYARRAGNVDAIKSFIRNSDEIRWQPAPRLA